MAVKVAINGYGRIGRNVLRALYEGKRTNEIRIVAINDLGDAETNAHLTQYDTAHGKFPGEVSVDGGDLVVNGDRIKVCAERDPSKLPWKDLGVDIVLECTGLFTSKAKAGAHIAAGAKKVIISAPGDKDVDGTFVYGVNHEQIKASHEVISNASCTTNCLAPLAKVLHEKIGIVHGLMSGFLHLIVPAARFRLLAGADALSEYTFNTGTAKHRFCRHCGIKSFYVPRSNPDGFDVNVHCLDAATIERIDVTVFDDTRRDESEAAIAHLSR